MFDEIPRRRLAWYAVGLGLAVAALINGCAPVAWDIKPVDQQDGARRVRVAWSPPCIGDAPPCGGPWVDYVLELRGTRGTWNVVAETPDTSATIALTPGTWYARVAARNAAGILGPYSPPSDPLTIGEPDRPNIDRPVEEGIR